MSDRTRNRTEPSRRDPVVETFHGEEVHDPWRWLEEPADPETVRFGAERSAETEAFVRSAPEFAEFGRELERAFDYTRHSLPVRRGAFRFFWRHDGLRNQPVLLFEDVRGGGPVVALDPNLFSADGTVAVTAAVASPDGRLLAYCVAEAGSDWQVIRVRDLASGADLPDILRHCRFTRPAWSRDGRGFFYGRFPAPGEVAEAERANHQRVFWHRIGTPQEADALVYARPDDPTLAFHPIVTEDGEHLCLHVTRGTETRNRFYVRRVDGGAFVRLLDAADAEYHLAGSTGGRFFFKTDRDAPLGRVVAIDLADPSPERWREVVPERDALLESAELAGGHLVLHYMRDVTSEVLVVDLAGRPRRTIDLPGRGTVAGITGRADDPEVHLGFTSFLHPFTVLRHDLASGETVRHRGADSPFDPSEYEERQVFFPSRDGTRVPMFLVHRRGLALDGANPTLLYGYGGFKVSTVAGFNPAWLPWLERGGVFAAACIRGGGEYGEAWHRDGMLERKENVFDDFCGAAEWLAASGYTSPGRLAIMGGSNGGLLVAACMLRRPELFGSVVCRVPVTDMLRYHRFTVGRYWIPEYGDPERDPALYRVLRAYSPLHNVRPGAKYPPLLVTTAESDDRVVPAHAKKFVAAMRELSDPGNIALLRLEPRAGHGQGKPLRKQIEEYRDIFAFLSRTLDGGGRREE